MTMYFGLLFVAEVFRIGMRILTPICDMIVELIKQKLAARAANSRKREKIDGKDNGDS